jgi:hypothetical protein
MTINSNGSLSRNEKLRAESYLKSKLYLHIYIFNHAKFAFCFRESQTDYSHNILTELDIQLCLLFYMFIFRNRSLQSVKIQQINIISANFWASTVRCTFVNFFLHTWKYKMRSQYWLDTFWWQMFIYVFCKGKYLQ